MRTLCAALLILCGSLWAAEEPVLSPAQMAFYNLDFEQAIQRYQANLRENPDDLPSWNGLAYSLLYREMFRVGALESQLVSGSNPFLRRAKMDVAPAAQQQFESALGEVMARADARLTKKADDTQALYHRGVALGLRANWNFLVRKSWNDSLKDATAARKAHQRVLEIDPRYTDAKLILGVHDYVVGSLPWHYKMLGFLVGFRGDKAAGIRQIEEVAREGNRTRLDARVLLAAVYRRDKHPEKAIPLLLQMSQRFPRNFLLRMELAQMYADLGNKDDALAQYAAIEQAKKSNLPGYERLPMEKLWYYEGNLLFWYNDLEQAMDRLRRVTPRAGDLDLNTGVYSWLRLGQTYDLLGRRDEAKRAYGEVLKLAPDSDAAREARRYQDRRYQRKEQDG